MTGNEGRESGGVTCNKDPGLQESKHGRCHYIISIYFSIFFGGGGSIQAVVVLGRPWTAWPLSLLMLCSELCFTSLLLLLHTDTLTAD